MIFNDTIVSPGPSRPHFNYDKILINIPKGEVYTYLAFCGRTQFKHESTLAFQGTIRYHGSTGHLSADYYPAMKVFELIGEVAALSLAVWLLLSGCYFNELNTIHFYITCSLLGVFLEFVCRETTLSKFNEEGNEPLKYIVFAVILLIIRKNIMATLLLLASEGRFYKGGLAPWNDSSIFILFIYFLCFASNAITSVLYSRYSIPIFRLVSFIAAFGAESFLAIVIIRRLLKTRRIFNKLNFYSAAAILKILIITYVAISLLSFCISLLNYIYQTTVNLDEYNGIRWKFEEIFAIFDFVILGAFLFLYSPTKAENLNEGIPVKICKGNYDEELEELACSIRYHERVDHSHDDQLRGNNTAYKRIHIIEQ